MKNKMTPDIQKFIQKAQNLMNDLYDEYTQIEIDGLTYECPLTRFMDDAQDFFIKEPEILIDENE